VSRYRKQVVLYLAPALDEALRLRASNESRTVSKMGEILLTEALADELEETEAAHEPVPIAVAKGGGYDAALAKVSARGGKCPHGVPKTAYCKKCSG
jgi:hypothetical protein